MAYVNKMVARAEEFIWNNWKFYLMSQPTCLLDLLLEIKDPTADNPFDRYVDFPNSLEEHMGLGSYTTGQAAQFSKTPYLTVNIAPIPTGNCSTRIVMGFDVVYSTDTPPAEDGTTRYVGSSSESVAKFRADMMTAIDGLFYYAYPDDDPRIEEDAAFQQSFMDALAGTLVTNPANPNESHEWEYNVDAFVNEDAEISEVSQLKREDRSTGLNVFHIMQKFDVNRMWGNGWDCGC